MLRTTSNSLVKTIPAWRNASIYFPAKQYTTSATSTPAATEKKEKTSLSQRLGGSGRGKVISEATSSDPFASFLANAKKSRGPNNNNDRRNGNFTPRPRKQQQENKGQFADAAEGKTENNNKPRQPRAEGANRKTNSKPRTQQRPSKEGAALAEGESDNVKRQPRTNNNNNNNRNNRNRDNNNKNGDARKPNNRRLNLRSQPQEVRTRRATTFIDRDIDWASFDTTIMTEKTEAVTENKEEDSELLLKDIQGDYSRYLEVGSSLSWPKMVDGAALSTLVGSNPTFDLSQKTAFMAAVSSATGGSASARK